MTLYIVKRIALALPTLFGVLAVCFLLTRLSGDPTDLFLPVDATAAARAAFRAQNGLDASIWRQFMLFLVNCLHGDFGNSLRFGEPAISLLYERIGATLELAAATLIISLIIGIPTGILAACWRGSKIDKLVQLSASAGQAVPPFYLGVLAILIFSVWLGWLPTSGRGGIGHLVLPAVTLAFSQLALVCRIMRSCMLDVLEEDYIRTARAKGVREFAVITKHALRNAIIPVMTVIALQIGTLMGGVIVTETVFAWPGIGRLVIQAIYARDYPIVQVVVVFFGVVFVAVNLIADILHAYLDPRTRQD